MRRGSLLLSLLFAGYVFYVFVTEPQAPPAPASQPDPVFRVDAVPAARPVPLSSLVVYRQPDGRVLVTASETPGEARFLSLYRWRGQTGALVLSSYPPEAGIEAEVLHLAVDPLPDTAPVMPERKTAAEADIPALASRPALVYTPEGLRELVRHAQRLGEQIEFRERELEALIEQL